MTTHTLTGIQVTYTSGNASAVATQTMQMVTTDRFGFSYKLTTPVEGGFSPITVKPSIGGALHAVTINGNRVTLNDSARVAQFSWGEGYTARILEVSTGANTKAFFVLDGTALPAGLTTLANYTAFIAGLTNITSVSRNFDGVRPGVSMDPTKLTSYTTSVQNDVIVGNATLDNFTKTIYTGAGDDQITGLAGKDKIDAGVGNDTINAGGDNDTVNGRAGDDSILGGDGNDSLIGDLGNDTISGGAGDDKIRGGAGNDSALGDAGADKIYLDAGNDFADGGLGADYISGGTGNDTLKGGADADRIFGGNDHDSIAGDAGDDVLRGDRGNDTVDGGAGADNIDGGYGNDLVIGGGDNDVLKGNMGNDTINGDAGNDSITGGDGNDVITGGAGNDTIKGGSKADTFIFNVGHDADRILDFKDNVDELHFSSALAGSSADAALAHATQVGRNVVFDFGDGDTLFIANITKTKLLNDIEII